LIYLILDEENKRKEIHKEQADNSAGTSVDDIKQKIKGKL
jgi:hypothetical protein